jgi:hypothetical protein
MKLLDKIALNSLVKTITSFILSLIKLFKPNTDGISTPEKRRPLKDLLNRWIK